MSIAAALINHVTESAKIDSEVLRVLSDVGMVGYSLSPSGGTKYDVFIELPNLPTNKQKIYKLLAALKKISGVRRVEYNMKFLDDLPARIDVKYV